MKTQHKFKTNQLGITFNQFGENLHKQLHLNYQKLYGTDTKVFEERKHEAHRKTN